MTWVYMVKNKGSKLYIGVTENPKPRLYYHNRKRGAEFTRNNPSFEIVFLEQYSSLSDARKREIQIKKWNRNKKELLIDRYKKGLETRV